MSPLILFTAGVIVLTTPALLWATWFCWSLYREDRTNGTALALAVVVTAAAVAFVLLAIPTGFFISGTPAPFGGVLILVAIDILGPAAFIVPAYLRWLRR